MKLKRRGADLVGLCPFHEDRSPSLIISPQKNLWNCLGACGKGGSVIDWVMRAEGISFRHAFELLKQEYLPLAAKSGPPPKKSTTVKLPPLAEHTIDDKRLLEAVVTHYHETLKRTPEAQQYLEKRGLQSAEMVEQFRLGFANRTLGYRLPEKNRRAGAEMRGRLQKLGIYRESGHEHFNGSLVIPIFDAEGRGGRSVRPEDPRHGLRAGTPHHSYLPGRIAACGTKQALAASKEIILCEALIDALTFWCAGYPQRDRVLRRRRLHRRSPRRVPRSTARSASASPTTATRPESEPPRKLAEELMARASSASASSSRRAWTRTSTRCKVQPATKSLGIARSTKRHGSAKASWPSSRSEASTISDANIEQLKQNLRAGPMQAESDLPLAAEPNATDAAPSSLDARDAPAPLRSTHRDQRRGNPHHAGRPPLPRAGPGEKYDCSGESCG